MLAIFRLRFDITTSPIKPLSVCAFYLFATEISPNASHSPGAANDVKQNNTASTADASRTFRLKKKKKENIYARISKWRVTIKNRKKGIEDWLYTRRRERMRKMPRRFDLRATRKCIERIDDIQ